MICQELRIAAEHVGKLRATLTDHKFIEGSLKNIHRVKELVFPFPESAEFAIQFLYAPQSLSRFSLQQIEYPSNRAVVLVDAQKFSILQRICVSIDENIFDNYRQQ